MKKEIQIGIGDSTKTARGFKDFSSRKHEITKEEEKFIALRGLRVKVIKQRREITRAAV